MTEGENEACIGLLHKNCYFVGREYKFAGGGVERVESTRGFLLVGEIRKFWY